MNHPRLPCLRVKLECHWCCARV